MAVQNSVVPSLERALNIIEYLSGRNEAVTLKQLSKELDIPTASAFRLIKNLVNRGYVTEVSGGQTAYLLGYRIMSLAASHERNSSLQTTAKPVMQTLANQLGQTAQLAIWRNGSLLYIDHAFSSAPLSVIAPLYEPVSVNVSASAKVILAYLPENERMAAVEQCTFPNLTKNTITDPSDFLQEIEHSRTSGYGFDNEEFSLGIGCLAVPIFDGKKACIGALGITGSIQAYRQKQTFREMLDALFDASAKITQGLGITQI
ncbi:MAG TPA: IclR family transcriptional regulator [Candidatus Choladousia intestinipullorum]|nr:IclR family transcriptional regulator [Candidatus Choladousia intestinipullorum]